MSAPGAQALHARLAERIPEAEIFVEDESHLHAGHAGAAGGAGHYRVRLVWAGFAGKPSVARHRVVYDAVADWMPHRVHALSITALAPSELPSA